MKTALHYFPLRPGFSLSALRCCGGCTTWDAGFPPHGLSATNRNARAIPTAFK